MASFEKLVRTGVAFNVICDYLGIPGTTFWNWKRKGERWINGGGEPPELEVYGQFVLRLRKAFAAYQIKMTKRLHRKHDPFWTQSIEILSRRDRLTWTRREPQGGGEAQQDADERFL